MFFSKRSAAVLFVLLFVVAVFHFYNFSHATGLCYNTKPSYIFFCHHVHREERSSFSRILYLFMISSSTSSLVLQRYCRSACMRPVLYFY